MTPAPLVSDISMFDIMVLGPCFLSYSSSFIEVSKAHRKSDKMNTNPFLYNFTTDTRQQGERT